MQDAPDLFVDLDSLDPQVIFAKAGAESVIAEIEEAARGAATSDLSTATARRAIADVAYKVARTKTALDDKGKVHVAYLKEAAKEVDAERKSIRDRLDLLRDTVRKPLTDWEDEEKARIDEHQQALAEIEACAVFDSAEPASADICGRLDRLRAIGGNRLWEEFEKRAGAAREAGIAKLTVMLSAAQRHDAERAELEALRQKETERADRERIAKAAEELTRKRALEADAAVAAANQRAANAEAAARQQVEAEQAAEARAAGLRMNDRVHRAKVNAAVRDSLCARAGLSSDLAAAVVIAIARGQIEHTVISY